VRSECLTSVVAPPPTEKFVLRWNVRASRDHCKLLFSVVVSLVSALNHVEIPSARYGARSAALEKARGSVITLRGSVGGNGETGSPVVIGLSSASSKVEAKLLSHSQ